MTRGRTDVYDTYLHVPKVVTADKRRFRLERTCPILADSARDAFLCEAAASSREHSYSKSPEAQMSQHRSPTLEGRRLKL